MNCIQQITALGFTLHCSDTSDDSERKKRMRPYYDKIGVHFKLTYEEFKEGADEDTSKLLEEVAWLDPISKFIAWRLLTRQKDYFENAPESSESDDFEGKYYKAGEFRDSEYWNSDLRPGRRFFENIMEGKVSPLEDIIAFLSVYFKEREAKPSMWLKEYSWLKVNSDDLATLDSNFNFWFGESFEQLQRSLDKVEEKIKEARKKEKEKKMKDEAKENERKMKAEEKENDRKMKAEEKENERKMKDQEKENEREKKAITHEFSSAQGVQYCKFCGRDPSWSPINCLRENGHKFTIRKIDGKFQPVCSKCGKDNSWCNLPCGY